MHLGSVKTKVIVIILIYYKKSTTFRKRLFGTFLWSVSNVLYSMVLITSSYNDDRKILMIEIVIQMAVNIIKSRFGKIDITSRMTTISGRLISFFSHVIIIILPLNENSR